MKTKLIGLCGAKGCGKSKVADALRDALLFNNDQYSCLDSFAYKMKYALWILAFRSCCDFHEFLELDKEIPRDELCGKSIRHALQTLGTEWGRNCIGEDFWVRTAMREIDEDYITIFDDVRFDNEAKAIKTKGGLVLQIKRDSVYEAGDKHSSEAGVSPEFVDYVIDNTGSLDETIENIWKVLD